MYSDVKENMNIVREQMVIPVKKWKCIKELNENFMEEYDICTNPWRSRSLQELRKTNDAYKYKFIFSTVLLNYAQRLT